MCSHIGRRCLDYSWPVQVSFPVFICLSYSNRICISFYPMIMPSWYDIFLSFHSGSQCLACLQMYCCVLDAGNLLTRAVHLEVHCHRCLGPLHFLIPSGAGRDACEHKPGLYLHAKGQVCVCVCVCALWHCSPCILQYA